MSRTVQRLGLSGNYGIDYRSTIGPELRSFPSCVPGALRHYTWAESAFAPHHAEDDDFVAVVSVEDAARGFDQLAVAPAAEFTRFGAAIGVIAELFDVPEDSLDELAGGRVIIERDVVGDGVEVVEGGLSPDYLSHRAMRFFALACVRTRPSSTARSPRARPSSRPSLRCSRS